VHRPVGPVRLAELPGAVQRVDDPHPLGGQPGRVVPALFGQHRITRAQLAELAGQELVRAPVPGGAQFPWVAAIRAQREQQLPGLGSQVMG